MTEPITWEQFQANNQKETEKVHQKVLQKPDDNNYNKDQRPKAFLNRKENEVTEENPDFTPNFDSYIQKIGNSINELKTIDKNYKPEQRYEKRKELANLIANNGVKAIQSISNEIETGEFYTKSINIVEQNSNATNLKSKELQDFVLCNTIVAGIDQINKTCQIITNLIEKYGQTVYPIDYFHRFENKLDDLKERINFIKISPTILESEGLTREEAIENAFKNTFGKDSVNLIEEIEDELTVTASPVEKTITSPPLESTQAIQQAEREEKKKEGFIQRLKAKISRQYKNAA
jgi:hypothetical protein